MAKIELGRQVKDIVTGYKGIAYGRSEYMNGCAHVGIQPPMKKDGELPELKWFDEPQIEYVGKKKITCDADKPAKRRQGGPKPAPQKPIR